jgi:hypothetical protein
MTIIEKSGMKPILYFGDLHEKCAFKQNMIV